MNLTIISRPSDSIFIIIKAYSREEHTYRGSLAQPFKGFNGIARRFAIPPTLLSTLIYSSRGEGRSYGEIYSFKNG